MNNTCFVIMPFGIKKDVDGVEINFDDIYEKMIKGAVKLVGDLEVLRCDDIEKPGWIQERMLQHIFEDRVAIVDISTLNPNVFYELGVRHALRKSVTVLIHREGTKGPFNIRGINSIEYTSTKAGMAKAQKTISTHIVNGLKEPDNVDSLVYKAIPSLRVEKSPKRLTKVETFQFHLVKDPARSVTFITGDRDDIMVGDIWVSSENTNMQGDQVYGKSTSATIRYLGAKKDKRGFLVEDTIFEELRREMAGALEVPPAHVIATHAGALARNNVKWVFHVASVTGAPREGYRPVQRIDQCVKNALRMASEEEFQRDGVASILFPIFGTGPAAGDVQKHAEVCVNAAVEYLEGSKSKILTVYFYAWSDVDLELCLAVAGKHAGLKGP